MTITISYSRNRYLHTVYFRTVIEANAHAYSLQLQGIAYAMFIGRTR